MPIQEQAFIDVRETLGPEGAGPFVHLRADQTRAIGEAIGRAGGAAIVYFASGEYTLHRIQEDYGAWRGDLELGADVTLWLDPDAKIVLDDSRLVILGGMVAPIAPIFDERGAGMVLLGGDLKEVFPEWWGASGDRLHDDSDAIQRAIDAASARRLPQSNSSAQRGQLLQPIPVTLRTMYSVGRTVVVGRALDRTPDDARLLSGFGVASRVSATLRGLDVGTTEYAAGLRALNWRPPEPGPEESVFERAMERAVLRFDLAYGSLLENVTLDASGEADYGLLLNSGQNGQGGEQTHAVSVRRCTFRGARKTQVQIGPPRVRAEVGVRSITVESANGRQTLQIPAEAVQSGKGDIPGFNLRGCRVECWPIAGLEAPLGIQFRTNNGVALRVADTVFVGTARACIDVTMGMVLIEGCEFHNNFREIPKPSNSKPVIASGFEEPLGEDVFLTASGSLTDGAEPLSGNGYVAMASCRSRSTTLFGTPNPHLFNVSNGRPVRSNLILGCRHEPPAPVEAPSVRWGRTAVGSVVRAGTRRLYGSDGTLCVVGSYLGGEMQVVTRAAQSVLLASRTVLSGNRAEIVVPSPHRTRGMTTVIFGLQCVAALFALLTCIGCQRAEPSSPADAGSDLGAVAKPDVLSAHDTGIGHRVDTGARLDARPRPDLVFVDPPDAGAVEDASSIDAPVLDAPPDAPLRDVFIDIPRYIDPRWAMEDVIHRDIEVTPLRDAAFVEDFGPPRQMRASCPAVTDGDETIAAPRLLFPMSPMRATSQRPTLFWSLPPGVDGARIELCRDRCCTQRISTLDVTGSSARPPQALPPGVVFWRARGRIGARVGRDTSFTWEFGVKHRDAPTDTAWGTIKDFNGDGFDDLIDPRSGFRVYWGGTDGLLASRFQTFAQGPTQNRAEVGDFDGDGLADALVISNRETYVGADGGRFQRDIVFVFRGTPRGVSHDPAGIRAGTSEFTVGDLNGDGFSDAVFGGGDYPVSTQIALARVLVVFGGPEGLGSGGQQVIEDPLGVRLRPYFGSVECAGDLDRDGYAELLVGDTSVTSGDGSVYVYRGRADGVDSMPARRIDASSIPGFLALPRMWGSGITRSSPASGVGGPGQEIA